MESILERQVIPESNRDYYRIEKAIAYLVQHQLEQPSLSELAQALATSESHLQRVFQSWAGISPKQFLSYLTKEYAKSLLEELPVNEAAYESGLSSPSRLYDLMVNYESLTPGEMRRRGEGVEIYYGSGPSPFGECFMALSPRGICKLGFFDTQEEFDVLKVELFRQYPRAEFVEKNTQIQAQLLGLFESNSKNKPLSLCVQGSPFRVQVWQALLKIPEGKLQSYQQIASAIGKPSATRAVASAIASNPLAVLIPCHRVIRSTGVMSGYRWGEMRKRALIIWEQGRKNDEQ